MKKILTIIISLIITAILICIAAIFNPNILSIESLSAHIFIKDALKTIWIMINPKILLSLIIVAIFLILLHIRTIKPKEDEDERI